MQRPLVAAAGLVAVLSVFSVIAVFTIGEGGARAQTQGGTGQTSPLYRPLSPPRGSDLIDRARVVETTPMTKWERVKSALSAVWEKNPVYLLYLFIFIAALARGDKDAWGFLVIIALVVLAFWGGPKLVQWAGATWLQVVGTPVLVGVAYLLYAMQRHLPRLFAFTLLCVGILALAKSLPATKEGVGGWVAVAGSVSGLVGGLDRWSKARSAARQAAPSPSPPTVPSSAATAS
ncbi:MAG TPA: hypothetical protein VKB80_07110 [Kofleriaceae bacterium]|nr:hypothetical protein [Kofleriaceae bacterium]